MLSAYDGSSSATQFGTGGHHDFAAAEAHHAQLRNTILRRLEALEEIAGADLKRTNAGWLADIAKKALGLL